MDDDPDFTAWFVPWKDARPDGRTPIGWYTLADLMAAWKAGEKNLMRRVIENTLEPEDAARARRNLSL